MRFSGAWTLGAISLAAALAAQGDGQGSPPPFADVIDVQVANLDVYVRDRDGSPVDGLREADFQIFEDGKPVEISNFHAVEGGRRVAEESLAVVGGEAPEGVKVDAVAVEPESPSYIVAYVDDANLSPTHRNRALPALAAFLRQRAEHGDKVMLVTFDGAVHVRQPFTSEWKDLARTLQSLSAMPIRDLGPHNRNREMLAAIAEIQRLKEGGPHPDPCSPELSALAKNYAQGIYNDVRASVEALTTFTDSLGGLSGRKGLLYLSNGLPLAPGQEAFELIHQMCSGAGVTAGMNDASNPVYDAEALGPAEGLNAKAAALDAHSFDATSLYRRLTDRANANRVTFYTLDATGAPVTSSGLAEVDDRRTTFQAVDSVHRANFQDSLNVMAAETGGRAVLDTIDFAPALARIGGDLDSYYSLGYRVEGRAESRARRLEIKVKRPGAEVRYRRSFQPQSAKEQLANLTLGTLVFGVEDNPLAVAIEVGEPVTLDGTLFSVPIRLRIPLGKVTLVPQEGAHVGRLSVQVGARDRQGRLAPVRASEVPISIPAARLDEARGKVYLYEVKMLMREGDHEVAVGLRDELANTASFLLAQVPVKGAAASPSR